MKNLLFGVIALMTIGLVTGPAQAQTTTTNKLGKDEIRFARIVKNFQGVPIHMDLGTTTYKNKDGVQVDLIPEIHIADGQHYENRNEQFKEYDSLCFELVAPKGKVPDREKTQERKKGFGLHSIQTMMSDMLGLKHQLTIIDYKAKNMVHADMSMEEMAEKAGERGDDKFTIILGVLADNIRKQNLAKMKGEAQAGPQMDPEFLLKVLTNPNYLKRFMAQQILSQDDIGPTLDQLLVKDRNAAAMKVVVERIKNGDKKIGLHYGAAHMPDFDQKMRNLGFEPVSQTWHEAWNMRITLQELMQKKMQKDLKQAIDNLLNQANR